eukprot:767963-Hanusia_phi.AAC.1
MSSARSRRAGADSAATGARGSGAGAGAWAGAGEDLLSAGSPPMRDQVTRSGPEEAITCFPLLSAISRMAKASSEDTEELARANGTWTCRP